MILPFPVQPDPAAFGPIADINAGMAPVEFMDVTTTLDVPPDRVLEGAKGHLQDVLLLGWDKDGSLYVASSIGQDATKMTDLASRFLHKYYNGDFCL